MQVDYIQEIHDLLYSDIVTPEALLDNLRQEAYERISYSKSSRGIVCELDAVVASGRRVTYRYSFDRNEFLQTVEKLDGSSVEPFFNRKVKIEKTVRKALNAQSTELEQFALFT